MYRSVRPIVLLCLCLRLVASAAADVPSAASLDGWRSGGDFRGWKLSPDGRLRVEANRSAELVSASAVWEASARLQFTLEQVVDPSGRIELHFRADGDQRGSSAIVMEPQRQKITFLRKVDGRIANEYTRSAGVPELAAPGRHELAYHIATHRVTVAFDGRELFAIEGAVPLRAGHLVLKADYVRAEFHDLAVEETMPECSDTFDSLVQWNVFYGPESWEIRDDSAGGRMAVFSAEADGALLSKPQWTHFSAEVRGRFREASQAWACFGLRTKITPDRGSFYVFEVRGKQNTLGVWKQQAGHRDPDFERTVPLEPIETGRWYTLRCRFEGDRIVVQMNGETVLEMTDPRPIATGATAISASYATVDIDDFHQEALDCDYRFPSADAPSQQPYDPGPDLPEPTPGVAEDEHFWHLAGPSLRVAVDKQTGMLGPICRADREPVTRRTLNLYCLENRQGQIDADAYGDRVQKLVDRSEDHLLLACENRDMPGVAIHKQYSLDRENGRLIETITLENRTEAPDRFLTLAKRTVIDNAYRNDAIYTGGSYFGPLVRACDVASRVLTDDHKRAWGTGITNGRPSWILAMNDCRGISLAAYRYRVNGRYVLPWNSIWTEPLNNLYHTPAGWEMGVCTLHLKPGEKRSAELHYDLFEGGRLDFYDRYMDLPEVRAVYERVGPRPKWLADLKMPVWVPDDYKADFTEEGYLVWLKQPFGIWGDLPTSGTIRTGGGIARWPVERVREELMRDRKVSPRIKAGFYTWAWSAHHKSDIVAEHPEWFIARDKQGEVRNAYPMALSYLRCLSAPGCLEATIRQYRDVVDYYPEDFQYLDNDGTGSQIIDWEHLRVDQDYHWQRLHEGILAAARSRGPETATFFNNRVLPQGDISFAEFSEREIENPD